MCWSRRRSPPSSASADPVGEALILRDCQSERDDEDIVEEAEGRAGTCAQRLMPMVKSQAKTACIAAGFSLSGTLRLNNCFELKLSLVLKIHTHTIILRLQLGPFLSINQNHLVRPGNAQGRDHGDEAVGFPAAVCVSTSQ